jgi:SAM-dependent methyltransferase
MSEAPPQEPRPAPLRVPVIDVATRNSLVAPTPKPPEAAQPSVVVQRAVKIISDHPPSASVAPSGHASGGSSPPIQRSSAPPAADGVPVGVRTESGALRVGSAVQTGPFGAMMAAQQAGVIPRSPSSPATARDGRASAAAAESYASVEVEPLDPLELAEGFDDTLDEGDEETVVEVSSEAPRGAEDALRRPPPAPPAAMRGSKPASPESENDVEITVTEDDGAGLDDVIEEPTRPSGEFQELDIDAEASAAEAQEAAERSRSMPPPPPPPPRISIPEPPDLSTLTRSARVQEIRPSKPRAHPWWEVFFDDDYLRTVRPPSPEQIARQCDFLEKRLRLRPGSTLLDVGCGLGLTVVELCTRGYLGVGLDLSLAMLSRASEEAQGRGMRINFLHSDMRDMNFEGAFDGLMCLGTTFGYFDDETNKKVLERFLRALKPGGNLVLDVVNRDHVIRAQPNLIWFEGDGCVCMEESEFNFFTSRLHVKRTVILDGGKQAETEYALRLYSLHELGQLLNSAGFRVTEVSGREALPGVFFGQESPQMIVVAERRGVSDATGQYKVVTD